MPENGEPKLPNNLNRDSIASKMNASRIAARKVIADDVSTKLWNTRVGRRQMSLYQLPRLEIAIMLYN